VPCSCEGVSSIRVFGNRSAAHVVDLAPSAEELLWRDVGEVHRPPLRRLGVASPARMREHHAAHGGPEPPPLEHHGIDDAFVGKTSTVWCWVGEDRFALAGPDRGLRLAPGQARQSA